MSSIDLSLSHIFDPITENINKLLPLIPKAAVTAIIGFIVIRVISWVVQWLLGFIRMPRGLKGIIVSLMDALLTVFLLIQILQTLGLGNLALVFSASVAAIGLALGSGSATLVADILGGIFLAQDKDFSVVALVRAKEGQVEGEIMSMDMRRTRIRDKDGMIHSMPNSTIERKEFVLVAKKRDRTDNK